MYVNRIHIPHTRSLSSPQLITSSLSPPTRIPDPNSYLNTHRMTSRWASKSVYVFTSTLSSDLLHRIVCVCVYYTFVTFHAHHWYPISYVYVNIIPYTQVYRYIYVYISRLHICTYTYLHTYHPTASHPSLCSSHSWHQPITPPCTNAQMHARNSQAPHTLITSHRAAPCQTLSTYTRSLASESMGGGLSWGCG